MVYLAVSIPFWSNILHTIEAFVSSYPLLHQAPNTSHLWVLILPHFTVTEGLKPHVQNILVLSSAVCCDKVTVLVTHS